MKRKFVVGDKVVVNERCLGKDKVRGLVGKVMTVYGIYHHFSDGEHAAYGVAFKKNVGGCDLEGECRSGYGWWFYSRDLELMR